MAIELTLGICLWSAFFAGLVALSPSDRVARRPTPVLALACLALIAAFSVAQYFLPDLLPLLMRDWALVASGQPWRLATSLLVQDGGYAGAAFNLAGLLFIGIVAERLLGRLHWAVCAALAVTAAQLAAYAWQPAGAGNSILNFALAGAVCAHCLLKRMSRPSAASATVAAVCIVILVFQRDIHGVAAATGALVESTWLAIAATPGNPA